MYTYGFSKGGGKIDSESYGYNTKKVVVRASVT